MPESIKKRKRQAVLSALFSGIWLLLHAVLLLCLRRLFRPTALPTAILSCAAVIHILLLLPLAVSLRQRLKEIEGGEEDEACQY